MSDSKIECACFGEILWDFFGVDEGREKGSLPKEYRRELGGAPANVAVCLARLGLSSSVVGGVGKDKFGDALVDMLKAEGVDTKHVIRKPSRTGITFITSAAKGEPQFMFYRHETADVMVTADDISSSAGKATFGVVGTSTLMTPSLREATMAFVESVRKAKGILIVDLNVRAHMWADEKDMKAQTAELAGMADIVKGSEDDLDHLANKRGLSWLETNAKNATWIMTRGENGAAAIGPHGQITAPTKRVRCVDATGAGDAFLSGVIAVLSTANARPDKASWKDPKVWTRALDVAHMLGAKAVAGVGSVSGLTTLDDVKMKIKLAKGA